jgi:hypothetical protein
MKKIILGALAAAAVAIAAIVAVASPASAAPGVTTHTVTLNAATDGVVDLPALNSQFTKMTIKVNDGSAKWGTDAARYTAYTNGSLSTGEPRTTGLWGGDDDQTVPGHGPLLLEEAQVGAVIYRVDGSPWMLVTPGITVSDARHVQVAYNDRPGSYDDNSGSLSLTVVRTKG